MKKHIWLISLVALVVMLGGRLTANTEDISRYREFLNQQQKTQAIEYLQQSISKADQPDKAREKMLARFALAITYFETEELDKAEEQFKGLLADKFHMEDYVHYYLGMLYKKKGDHSRAMAAFVRVLALTPHQKMRQDTIYQLALVAKEQKLWATAHKHLAFLERKHRRDEIYADVLWNLLEVESKWNSRNICHWARKLYKDQPAYALQKGMGFNLAELRIDGRQINCVTTLQDKEKRIKRLQGLGEVEQAQKEIEILRKDLAKTNNYDADRIWATFLVTDGQAQEAMKLLLPYYETRKTNFNYLMLLARVAAATGEYQLAVGTYYKAYSLGRRSRAGRKALYQAAFLSYQFQDYDGAARKFDEFVQHYSRSGLQKDAQWHIAWIQYLKADYAGAYNKFNNLLRSVRGPRHHLAADRLHYWMAMSLVKQSRYSEAAPLFELLVDDGAVDYYGLLAGFRLDELKAKNVRGIASAAKPGGKKVHKHAPNETADAAAAEENESEENLDQIADDDEAEAEAEEAPKEEIQRAASPTQADKDLDALMVKAESEMTNQNAEFHNARLDRRFERARDLAVAGLKGWAKWELFEIERSTSSKTNLLTLMNEYQTVGFYNRSAYIGQIHFGSQMSMNGLQGERNLWQYTYPLAFKDRVLEVAKTFDLPMEIIWSIMRAESQYKENAISSVGAIGLMQVMPYTGRQVARLLGKTDFKANDLFDPNKNIELGASYIQRLMKMYDHKVPLVAAAYNAGPHRVTSWLNSFGRLDLDEFVEHIPYVQTREYVKKVVTNYRVYTSLYGKGGQQMLSCLTQKVGVQVPSGITTTRENWDVL